jgi:hypothetical protein
LDPELALASASAAVTDDLSCLFRNYDKDVLYMIGYSAQASVKLHVFGEQGILHAIYSVVRRSGGGGDCV